MRSVSYFDSRSSKQPKVRIIKGALYANCYVMGDFNLDTKMNHRMDYYRKVPLKLLNDFAIEKQMIQIVKM